MDCYSTTSFRPSTSLAAGALALAFAALLSGCDQETGIVIEVSKGSLEETPDTLHFLVGVEEDIISLGSDPCGSADGLQRFVQTPVAATDEVNVRDRDLAANPYRLFVRPDANLVSENKLVIMVEALKNDERIGVGALKDPVAFLSGKTLEWKVALEPAATVDPVPEPTNPVRSQCLCASEYTGPAVVFTPRDDTDCDGYAADDCDDNDASIYPNPPACGNARDDNCDGIVDEIEVEVCDGWDNNCDGVCDEGFDEDGDYYTTCGSIFNACDRFVSEEFKDCRDDLPMVHPFAPELCDGLDNNCIAGDDDFPQFLDCYTELPDGNCLVGYQFCDNTVGGEGLTECQPRGFEEDFAASPQSCERAEECVDEVDSFTCSNRKVYNMEVNCEVAVIGSMFGLNVCPGAVRPMHDFGYDENEECVWTVLGQGLDIPYDVQLESQFGIGGYVVDGCRPDVRITQVFGDPQEYEQVFLWMRIGDNEEIHLRVKLKADYHNFMDGCPPEEQVLRCQPPQNSGS